MSKDLNNRRYPKSSISAVTREMQFKTTEDTTALPPESPKFKNNINAWWGYGATRTPIPYRLHLKWCSHFGNKFGGFKLSTHLRFTYSIPRYLPKKKETTCLHKELSTNVLSSFTCNSQILEKVHVSINRRMEKQTVAWLRNGLLPTGTRNKLLMNATAWMKCGKTLHHMKEARPKRVHTIWFHLYEILE